MALRAQNAGHARCVIIVEAGEESDSRDLFHYIEKLRKQIGPVSLIVCLDSAGGNYDQLWITTSLRGILNAWVDVRVLTEGVHSGIASGIVPGSYRIARQLISRLEDEASGDVKPSWLKVEIPAETREQARKTAKVLGRRVFDEFPFVNDKVRPVSGDVTELLLNNAWRPQLAVTGIQGLPEKPESAGNVMLPYTRFKISLRLPPTLDAEKASAALVRELTADPPYDAVVTVSDIDLGDGWAAPPPAPWLAKASAEASIRFFRTKPGDTSKEALYVGIGGSITFMGLLGEMFPEAQFMITGVLGPHSNAHGPNEFLDLPYARKVTMCVAHVLAAHYAAGVTSAK
jgi:acetylornithine deacetylase/succinyl-diaminopimelate desuccinylase-like protein